MGQLLKEGLLGGLLAIALGAVAYLYRELKTERLTCSRERLAAEERLLARVEEHVEFVRSMAPIMGKATDLLEELLSRRVRRPR